MLTDYLGHKHEYGTFDCINLVKQFYSTELGVSFDLPPYPLSRAWIREFSTDRIDSWVGKYAKKVLLTDAKNYDLMVFKSNKTDLVTHFGIYIMPNKLLHIEEEGYSRIDNLSDYWIHHLYAIFRHDKLV